MGRKITKFIGILIVLLLVAAAVYIVKDKTTVVNVYVEGNVHYSEEEIKDLVMTGFLGDNSIYLSIKYKNRGIDNVPFVDVMDVKVLEADTIKIIVYEKALTGYIKYLDSYMYFDRDGCVVESSGIKTVGVPQITGLHFDSIVLGEQLPVENAKVFETIMSVTNLFSKYDLNTEKLYFAEDGTVTAYFGEVKVALGDDLNTLEDKIMILPGILPNLEGKQGTLYMVNYSENNGKYTFKPD